MLNFFKIIFGRKLRLFNDWLVIKAKQDARRIKWGRRLRGLKIFWLRVFCAGWEEEQRVELTDKGKKEVSWFSTDKIGRMKQAAEDRAKSNNARGVMTVITAEGLREAVFIDDSLFELRPGDSEKRVAGDLAEARECVEAMEEIESMVKGKSEVRKSKSETEA